MKVNYKSDFELTIQLTAGGEAVAVPTWDWSMVFYTCDRQAVYQCSRIGGVCDRCKVNADGTVTVYFDKHGLRPGALVCEFCNHIPDTNFSFDKRITFDPVTLGVELVRGAGDEGMTPVELELAGDLLAQLQAIIEGLDVATDYIVNVSAVWDDEENCFVAPPLPSGPGLPSWATIHHDALAALAEGRVVRYKVALLVDVSDVGYRVHDFAVASYNATAPTSVIKAVGYEDDTDNATPELFSLYHTESGVRVYSRDVATLEAVEEAVAPLQPRLTAGTGIDITNNVISATGGGGGTGIESIEQTVTSDESGGINVVTITMSDSTTADFEIMNGKKGDKGDSGVDLGEVVLVNDLTTGGSESALSAEQGVVLKGMVDSCAHFSDDDKIILNQPLLDLIGVEGDDYAVIENMKFSAWNGNITTATGNYLILVTMKNGVISYDGLPISGYHGWWTADVKPSTSDPTVDEDGNAVTYTKGYYNNGTRSNVAVAKPYLLFDAGTDVTNFVMAFLAFIPTPIYDVKSVNDGIRIVSSSIDGVGDKTMQLLKQGIATKHNFLDTTCVLNGMNFGSTSPFSLTVADGSIYLQPIPSGAKNVLVRGLRATGNHTYHRIFVLNENLTILANDNFNGTVVVNQYVSLGNVTGAKYLAFNASGTNVANDINDVVVLFDVPKDYPRWIAYHNNFADETPILDTPIEFAGQKNYLCNEYVKSINGKNWEIEIPNITERFFTFIMPDAEYVTSANSFIQYDSNGNVLKSEVWNSVKGVNFGEYSKCYKQVRLEQGCAKIYILVSFALAFNNTSLEEMVARGNKLLLNNRIVEWGNNQMSSVNGKPLNIKAKSPLDGKLICCMGDSITDFGSSSTNGSWAWYIQRNYDCGVANYGRGNAHFCDVANTDPTADTDPGAISTSTTPNNVVSTQVRWCIREMTEDNITPDAIVLTGLTNDAFSAVNLGDLDTALAAYPMTADEVHTDFYGAAVYMVSKLRSAFPSAKIFFATPPRSLNPTQMQRLVQYVEAMRNVAKALGCGVIDFFDESLVEYPKATYNASTKTWTHDNPMYNTNDVLHPSQLGVNKMGQLASAKLCEYLQ